MLVVETIAKIRRAHFIEGKPIKQICRELRVSRNTVRKVIRSGATEFSYDRATQPRPKIDPWRSELDEMLADNARRPKREQLTLRFDDNRDAPNAPKTRAKASVSFTGLFPGLLRGDTSSPNNSSLICAASALRPRAASRLARSSKVKRMENGGGYFGASVSDFAEIDAISLKLWSKVLIVTLQTL